MTPEELRNLTFEREFRGYNKNLVEQVLHSAASELQHKIEEIEKLRYDLSRTEAELNRLKEVESTMFKAMKEANDNAALLLEQAQNEANTLLSESKTLAQDTINTANIEADDMILEAKDQARQILAKANADKEALLNDANDTIERLQAEAKADLEASEKEYNSLDIAKQQLLYDLNQLLGNTSDRLGNIQTKYAPESFNARKIDLGALKKAEVEQAKAIRQAGKTVRAAKKETVKKIEKPLVKKTTKAKAEPIVKVKASKKVGTQKMQEMPDNEDDGLPTVSKIIANNPDLTPVQERPELNVDAPVAENVSSGSFFDSFQ